MSFVLNLFFSHLFPFTFLAKYPFHIALGSVILDWVCHITLAKPFLYCMFHILDVAHHYLFYFKMCYPFVYSYLCFQKHDCSAWKLELPALRSFTCWREFLFPNVEWGFIVCYPSSTFRHHKCSWIKTNKWSHGANLKWVINCVSLSWLRNWLHEITPLFWSWKTCDA